MARNNIYHSAIPRRFAKASSRVLKKPVRSPQPRIIVVVGAGASHAAGGLPCGNDAAEGLREATVSPATRDLVAAEIERLVLQFNLEEKDFETILLALSNVDRAGVLDKLRRIYGRRHHPWLGYEVLAHCLKHKFVDAIINFNFDEILDQAIDDELGERGVYKVVLDGDCPPSPGDWIDNKSHRFSGRFTSSRTALPVSLRRFALHANPTRR